MIESYLKIEATQTIGFDAIQITSPFLSPSELSAYKTMLDNNEIADMGYLERHWPFKENPNLLLDGVKSAIVVIKSYKNTEKKHLDGNRKIARYAVGQDYHRTMVDKLKLLEDKLLELAPEAKTYIGADSRPIAERSLAVKSGIGFRARNSMIIRPKLGSYFFIGVMLTTLELAPDDPLPGSCGTCRRCVDACPTDVIGMDGSFKIDQCIGYRTIEHKAPLTKPELESYDGWVFGCDICQEVCPFNHANVPLTDWMEFRPESGVGFDFFEKEGAKIPKNSVMYRSRKRVVTNVELLDEA